MVAPFAGAWIEMPMRLCQQTPLTSLPSRERGLKFFDPELQARDKNVAPFAGAWIEIR